MVQGPAFSLAPPVLGEVSSDQSMGSKFCFNLNVEEETLRKLYSIREWQGEQNIISKKGYSKTFRSLFLSLWAAVYENGGTRVGSVRV